MYVYSCVVYGLMCYITALIFAFIIYFLVAVLGSEDRTIVITAEVLTVLSMCAGTALCVRQGVKEYQKVKEQQEQQQWQQQQRQQRQQQAQQQPEQGQGEGEAQQMMQAVPYSTYLMPFLIWVVVMVIGILLCVLTVMYRIVAILAVGYLILALFFPITFLFMAPLHSYAEYMVKQQKLLDESQETTEHTSAAAVPDPVSQPAPPAVEWATDGARSGAPVSDAPCPDSTSSTAAAAVARGGEQYKEGERTTAADAVHPL